MGTTGAREWIGGGSATTTGGDGATVTGTGCEYPISRTDAILPLRLTLNDG
jgi:hypothetical protein